MALIFVLVYVCFILVFGINENFDLVGTRYVQNVL